MNRITQHMLEMLADRINDMTDSPSTSWTKSEIGPLQANIGNYHISYAYGGACLHRMHNEHGGVTCPIQNYHSPKRELYDKMHAFMSGLQNHGGQS